MINKLIVGGSAAALMLAVSMAAKTVQEPGPRQEAMSSVSATSQLGLPADPGGPSSPQTSHRKLPELPEPSAKPDELQLWQPVGDRAEMVVDGNPAKRLQATPNLVKQLHVGQRLQLHIPQQNGSVSARLTSTHNPTATTHVWQGVVDDPSEGSILITRGQKDTHVVIAMREGTYSAVIDNASGDTVLVDEGDISVNQIPYDDGVHIPPLEENPPPVSPDW